MNAVPDIAKLLTQSHDRRAPMNDIVLLQQICIDPIQTSRGVQSIQYFELAALAIEFHDQPSLRIALMYITDHLSGI